jgi:hypothetical protein
MKPGILSLACLALAAASPALAQPIVISGAAPEPQPSGASATDCVLEPTGAASARIRCRAQSSARPAPPEVTVLISAQAAAPPARCLGAQVVRLSGAAASPPRVRPTVVEGEPAPACGA